jgi:hypothetical protein
VRYELRRVILTIAAAVAGATASNLFRTSHASAVATERPPQARRPAPQPVRFDTKADVERIALSEVFGAATDQPESPFAVATTAPEPPRHPTITLRGIVGGPPWLALVDSGSPGGATVILQRGDRFAGARVQSVSQSTVIVRRRDSTLTLSLTEKWR